MIEMEGLPQVRVAMNELYQNYDKGIFLSLLLCSFPMLSLSRFWHLSCKIVSVIFGVPF